MTDFSQGDVIRINGFNNVFLIVSKNAYIRATKTFHVCPILEKESEGPLHICVEGTRKYKGVVICEQMKLIDPGARGCMRVDRLKYEILMNISDAIQGIFEYD